MACGAARPAPRDIYPDPALAKPEIAAALREAARTHKRVLLVFGGNWCGDCIVLDRNFHKPENQELLDKYYVLVDVNIGRMDKNTDIAEKYGVPLAKGVPALSVLDGHGNVIYSQKNGEFEALRRMDPASVHDFLEQWKPAKS